MVHEPIELKIASDKFRSLIDLAIAQSEATILIPETKFWSDWLRHANTTTYG
jgi:hypothetical protein